MLLITLLLLWLNVAQAAFVRMRECGSAETAFVNPIFEPSSLSGGLDVSDSTTLWLSLSGDYQSPHDCEKLNGEFAKLIVDVKVLGRSVGQQIESKGVCPTVSQADRLRYDPRAYSRYKASYALDGAYRLSTFDTTIHLRTDNGSDVACIAAYITPDIGPVATNLLKAVPATVMLLSGIVAAGIKSYRSRQSTMFRYEISNKSRDPAESLLPGMGECLQYIQFVFMAGCLTLYYPGFFKPIVSQLAWSSLIYANGPITHEFTYPGIGDGIYAINGTYGLEEMAQVLGATTMSDLWTNATINLSVMVLAVVVTIQLASLIKWMWRLLPSRATPAIFELQAEFLTHIQHAGWSVLRMVLHYYLLPIVAFSLYQPLMATFFPVYRTFLAVALVALLAVTLGFVVRYLGAHNRQNLFFNESSLPRGSSQPWISDALYGLPLIRGTAIGGLQISGVAQIIILIACEVALILCLIPHRRKYSAWKSISCSAVRLATVVMSCAFLPSAGLGEGAKGLVGYFILSLHAAVLMLGFFVPTMLDVVKFALGRTSLFDPHSDDSEAGPHDAPIFGLNQLSRRSKRGTSFSHLPALLPPNPALTAYVTHTPLPPRPPSSEGETYIPDDASQFYRPPRRNVSSSTPSERSSTLRSMPSVSEMDAKEDSCGSSMELIDEDEREFDPQRRSDVDYSVREADQYYGRAKIVMGSSSPQKDSETSPRVSDSFSRWKRGKGKEKEKGFEVIRPNRNPS